jgi:hypothetical protein
MEVFSFRQFALIGYTPRKFFASFCFYLRFSFNPKLECRVGWVDIGTGTKVPLRFVTYLSKVTKINEKSGLTQ